MLRQSWKCSRINFKSFYMINQITKGDKMTQKLLNFDNQELVVDWIYVLIILNNLKNSQCFLLLFSNSEF